jgi:hypothetical protein
VFDASTLERLIELRLLLHNAQEQAQDRSVVGRHSAIILLDGVCEYAMGLASAHLGLPHDRDFHRNLNRLSTHLATDWSKSSWKGVQELHGMRTESQHRGTRADADQIPRWATESERFIASLVAAVFNVELQAVFNAHAVETPSVRAKLSRRNRHSTAELKPLL